jgi:hypothetical protein
MIDVFILSSNDKKSYWQETDRCYIVSIRPPGGRRLVTHHHFPYLIPQASQHY